MTDERFGKAYKLCSRKTIERLFREGQQVRQFPFTVYFLEEPLPEGQCFQLVFSAPKRSFKRAHDRNRIKRLMRETFRKKKLILEERLRDSEKQFALFVIYTAKEELPLRQLLVKTEQLLKKLIEASEHESI